MRTNERKAILKSFHYIVANVIERLCDLKLPAYTAAAYGSDERVIRRALKSLAGVAGVNPKGLTHREIYLQAMRFFADRGQLGGEAFNRASEVWCVVYHLRLHVVMSAEIQRIKDGISAQREQRRPATGGAQPAQTAPPPVTTLDLGGVSGQTAAEFGIREDDRLELESADAPRPGEVLVVLHDGGFMVGRFVRFDDEPAGRKIVLDKPDGQWSYPTAGLRLFRPLSVTRRFGAPENPAEGSGLSPEAQCRIEELRRRLDWLTSNDEESERFRVEREIYDLTRAPACADDEWPELVAA